MPSRIIREGINSSARINSLSLGADLLYRRLLLVVDDYGRFHGTPITILVACWPTCPDRLTVEQIKEWLLELSDGENPLVIFYEDRRARYLVVTDFRQLTRSKSKFPAPPAKQDEKLRKSVLGLNPQLLIDCGANVLQHDRTSRISYFVSRISKEEAAASLRPVEEPLPQHFAFEKTHAEIARRFPESDELLTMSIVKLSAKSWEAVSDPKIPLPDDDVISRAVIVAAQSKNGHQKSAALFRKTVPALISNWAKYGIVERVQPRKLTSRERALEKLS